MPNMSKAKRQRQRCMFQGTDMTHKHTNTQALTHIHAPSLVDCAYCINRVDNPPRLLPLLLEAVVRLREPPLLRRAAAPVGVDEAEDDADEATAVSTAKERAGGMNNPAAA
jgi:hypothetical protein